MNTLMWLSSWISTFGSFVIGLAAVCFFVIIIPAILYSIWFDRSIAKLQKELQERKKRLGIESVDFDQAFINLKNNLGSMDDDKKGLRIYRE